MDNRLAKQEVIVTEEVIDNVVIGDFPLMRQPVDYQLTIHINNILNAYGKHVIKEFKETLYNPESDCRSRQVERLINHYGLDTLKNWFTLIYGWHFEKAG